MVRRPTHAIRLKSILLGTILYLIPTEATVALGEGCNLWEYMPIDYLGCFGDIDGNHQVNPGDRGFISANIGQSSSEPLCRFDLDGNGFINPGDRGFVSANIGQCNNLLPQKNELEQRCRALTIQSCNEASIRCVTPSDDLEAIVQQAQPGDGILILPGTYQFLQLSLYDKANLCLKIADPTQTNLEGSFAFPVVSITSSSSIYLDQIPITRAGLTGINIGGSQNVVISRAQISNQRNTAIQLDRSRVRIVESEISGANVTSGNGIVGFGSEIFLYRNRVHDFRAVTGGSARNCLALLPPVLGELSNPTSVAVRNNIFYDCDAAITNYDTNIRITNNTIVNDPQWDGLPSVGLKVGILNDIIAGPVPFVVRVTSSIFSGISGTGIAVLPPAIPHQTPPYVDVSFSDMWQNAQNTSGAMVIKSMLFTDPEFVAPIERDYHLDNCSPLIDAGAPADPYYFEAEPQGDRVDIGAFGNTRESGECVGTEDN